MADYAQGPLRAKKKELEEALKGLVTDHHRRILKMLLQQVKNLEQDIAALEAEIRRRLEPHQKLVECLDEIPGVDEITAWTILAEVGFDMKVFQTPERLASWAGLCPGNRKSAGKRINGRTRKGNRWLRRALTQSALGASRSEGTYLRSFYWRLAARRGAKKGRLAIGHKQLKIAFFMIRHGLHFKELGPDFFDRRQPERPRSDCWNDWRRWASKSPSRRLPHRAKAKM